MCVCCFSKPSFGGIPPTYGLGFLKLICPCENHMRQGQTLVQYMGDGDPTIMNHGIPETWYTNPYHIS